MGLAVAIFTIALVIYPKEGFESGIEGLKLFWMTVFPSLLPFFILSELMLGLGIVRGFGVLLEPLMRPLFGVPGIGAFALSMGLAAGYPMDAVITARFREDGLCSRVEGERLLAFTNTADPLFMIGAVAVGMFKSAALGGLLAIAHYISSFLVGIGFKFWGRKSDEVDSIKTPVRGILRRAYSEMVRARIEDGRPFGKILGNAVTESISTLMMICGFIVFFAVFIHILNISGIMAILGWPIAAVYKLFGISTHLVGPTLSGALEIDIGTSQAAAATAPLLQKLALVSAVIAWSGLAVHAQVASVLTQTDIRMTPYFLARFLHAVLAAAITMVLWWLGIGKTAGHVFAHSMPALQAMSTAASSARWWHTLMTGLTTWVWVTAGIVAIALVLIVVRGLQIVAWRVR
jgi:sporulation integral membrane protein YlbJ